MPRYLTKSRFKLSLECATKLFYTNKKEYANQKSTDTFLRELAKGGMQIGDYGRRALIPSLNYDLKTWITEGYNFDPYKTLEPVFDEYDQEALDSLVSGLEGLGDGGTAMMAYNMLQFSEIPIDQREKIRNALLRYCELDTLAMVMLLEGLKSQLQ